MTINDLLLNKHYRCNQTLLAIDLDINRSTLRAYMLDEEGKFHDIRTLECGTIELFTNQSNKIRG